MVGFCECFTKWILQKKLKYVCFCKGNLLGCNSGLAEIIVRTKWRFSCASGDTARAKWKGNCFFGDGKFLHGKSYWTYAVRFIRWVTTFFYTYFQVSGTTPYLGTSCGYACHARSVMYFFVHSFRERGNCCHNLYQSTPSFFGAYFDLWKYLCLLFSLLSPKLYPVLPVVVGTSRTRPR